jgi:hypothetical protein
MHTAKRPRRAAQNPDAGFSIVSRAARGGNAQPPFRNPAPAQQKKQEAAASCFLSLPGKSAYSTLMI